MFTCNTCSLGFPTHDDQRIHMKSDWHRYNLKRRVADLPALDEDVFILKISLLSITDEVVVKKEKQITKKEQRRREKEALREKRRAILEAAEKASPSDTPAGADDESAQPAEITDKADVEATDKTELETSEIQEKLETSPESDLTPEQAALLEEKLSSRVVIPPTTCLFSHPKENKTFDTVEANVEYMFKTYGLYIPETTYLVDLPGLISYLGEKISFGFCISCNYQGRNAEAVREHMKQKRHMRIPYETEEEKLEISDYYDFSSTYEDGPQEDGEWEDVDGENVEVVEGEEDTENVDDIPIQNNLAYQNASKELILPSGTILGHRQNNKYYQQYLVPERVLSEGQGTVIAAETRHMLTVKDKAELAIQKRTWARQLKSADQFDRKAKKFINQQEHFRDPLLQ